MTIPDYLTPGGGSEPANARPQRDEFTRPRRSSARPSRSSRSTQPGGAGGSRPVAIAAVVLVVLAGAVALGWNHLRPTESSAASALVAPPAPVVKAMCLDASTSVDRDGQLSRVAVTDLAAQVRTVHTWPNVLPDYEQTPAVAATHLQVRIVQADSYGTQSGGRFVHDFTIPAVHGLSGGKPTFDDPALDEWNTSYDQVVREQKAATQAQSQAAGDIGGLNSTRSDGSDVTGCIAAALDAAESGTRPQVMVVSDLEDTSLTTADGDARQFSGDYAGSTLTIVQACPSGVQATCTATADAFLNRMADLGIDRNSVTIVRPESVDSAIRTWLAG